MNASTKPPTRTRLILCMTLALLCCAPFAPALAADSEADAQFTFAYRLLQRKEEKLAAEAFEKFISLYKNDKRVPDAHYHLALLDRKQGRIKSARQHLQHVDGALYVTPQALGILKGQVLLEDNDPKQALTVLESLDAKAFKDADARASRFYLMGVAYSALKNLDAAAKSFDAATEADSSVRAAALFELGKVRADLNQPAPAIEALVAASKASPDVAPQSLSLAASLAYRQGQFPFAADLYKQIIQNHQRSDQFRGALLGRLRALLAATQPQQVIDEHAAVTPLIAAADRPEADYLLAAAQVQLKQYKPAVEAFDRYFSAAKPEDALYAESIYLYTLCKFQLAEHQIVEHLVQTFNQRFAQHARAADVQFLSAQNALKLGQTAAAINRLTPLVGAQNAALASRALLQRAALYESAAQPTLAIADYLAFATRFPTHASTPDAERRAIDLAFSSGDFAKVLTLSQPWLARQGIPANVANPIRFKRAIALIKTNRNDQALAELDTLLTAKPENTLASLAHFYQGLLLASAISTNSNPKDPEQAKRIDAAVQSLNTAVKGPLPDAQKTEAMHVLGRLHRIAGNDAQALQIFQQLGSTKQPSSFDPPTALWIGQLWLQRDKPDAALPWFTNVAARSDAEPKQIAEALFRVGQCQQKLAAWDKAIEAYTRAVAFSQGYADQGRLGLAQCLYASGKPDDALDQYDELVSVASSRVSATALLESAIIKRRQAAKRAAAGDEQAAERLLTDARRRLNRIDILHNLPELAPIPQRALLELALASAQAQRKDTAAQLLERLAKDYAATAWAALAGVEKLILEGNPKTAAERLKTIEARADDPMVRQYAVERLAELK